jgi:hypothetical protein
MSRAQKTRPPAQYNAKRPCQPPDIQIGSRHPVSAHCPGIPPVNVIQFTIGAKISAQLLAGDGRHFGNHLIWLAVLCRFRSRGNGFMAYAALVRQLFV